MWTHPGKKLLFMGGEFAQVREWNHDAGLDWFLLDNPHAIAACRLLVADLNGAYTRHPALCTPRDYRPETGFAWVVMDDSEQSVFAYLRTGVPKATRRCWWCATSRRSRRHGYRIGVPQAWAPGQEAGQYRRRHLWRIEHGQCGRGARPRRWPATGSRRPWC